MVDVENGGGEIPSITVDDSQSNADAARPGDSTLNSTVASPGAQDDMAPSKAPSKASSTRTSTPAAASPDDGPPSQSANGSPAPPDQALQSQPMSATMSSSSNPPAKEPKEPPAAPYGTRSRNRPERTSRVNYAEDVEMDFEMAPAPSNGNGSEPPSRGSVATDGGQSTSAGGGKKGSGAGQSNASWGASGPNPKDIPPNANMPGTSTFVANPASTPAPPPKRRKNAASHATNGSQANAAAPSQPGPRRANHGAAAASSTTASARETNMLTFENSGARLKGGVLVADDGQTVAINDQVYLVCEPPGEPYYLCRVMEFIHANNDPVQKVDMLRVNWFYRPRDVQRYNNDTRLVYATMHSDQCPLTSLRGKCQVLHRSEIDDLDEYRKTKDSFWFNQVFDRFIHRWYDVIPTSQVINVPDKVKKALDERWKYICLETSRVKELTSAVKSCKRCVGFCATNDSVECAVCRNTYHMNCVRPPLLKKPSRGFAWACGPCSRAQEKKLEARRTPLLGSGNEEGDEEEVLDEEEEEANAETTAPSPNDSDTQIDLHPGTQAEIALAKMWPMRYLGIHCRVEDALQYDDRAIYPRASSRLGPRHQANVNVWHGRPVELVKPAEIKKRYVKAAGHKKDTKLSKETVAAIEADKAEKAKRPKWVMDEPPGYVRRGEDYPNKDSRCTAELTFKMPPLGVHSTRGEDNAPTITPEQVEAYMTRAKAFAKTHVGVEPWSTNFLTKCLALLTKHQYDVEAALKQVKKLDKRKDLKEPELTKDEEKKWNEGVTKYGSEIRSVRLHTSKTMHYGDAVRYYYMWKKTPKGKEIWGSYSNRKGKSKKTENDPQSRLLDDIADDQDDSAFDNEKAVHRKRSFQCKFCNNRHSRQWRRAPGAAPGQTVTADGRTSKDKANGYVVALCQRCANLWRKYAVKWENTEEIARKVAQGGGKAWKRRFDEELLREVYAATSDSGTMNSTPDYTDFPATAAQAVVEPPKKKQKTVAVGAADSGTSTPFSDPTSKKKEKEKPIAPPKAPTPPPVPAQPRLRVLPCAVCRQTEGLRLECAACRMNVHKACYGIEENRQANKWYCDTCKNDKKESVSYNYECVLCPQRTTEPDLYEPPKVSHKKKTDREREKERLEKELVEKAKEEYRLRQQEKGRPLIPREPLKRTADNNWVHVYCALWHPETKFSSAIRFDMVEGIGAPTLRYDATCKLCKTNEGACVTCQQCHANFHVGCAHHAGYTFGFDITPVKATRRDAVPTVTLNGETGTMMAAIWCKDHTPKTVVHPMYEEVEGTDLNALQLFAREFKQADLTLTGTARKANLVDQSTRMVPQATAPAQGNRRTSTVTTQTPTSARGRPSNAGLVVKEEEPTESITVKSDRKCMRCKIDASPRWWKVEEASQPTQNGAHAVDAPLATNGVESNTQHPANLTPQTDQSQTTNGTIDHVMTDAPPVAPHDQSVRLRVDTDVGAPSFPSYLCQKCHWKKLNAPDEPEERERSASVHVEPQQLPLRSPPLQPFVAPPPPPTLGGPWAPPPQQAPPLPHWHNGGAPGPISHAPPPHNLHNGINHPPPGPMGHAPPYHAPYNPVHQPNGYPAYSGPPVHSHIPPAPLRGPYPPPHHHGGPPPLHLTNGAMMVNGMHSPRMPYSPTHAHASRSTESPYNAPPQLPYPPLHHGSPAPGGPPTPRDAPMRDAPAVTGPPPPPVERANTGASASPSLRNLLH
ncbi:putative PHD type zinc finger protein with BAH domain-containing protein [Kalmusia sp. IMI 367209]|nr:putative PHD type zinc finger protein with BAH domain-containing protein [Kalmusia sp. IMI 367209]